MALHALVEHWARFVAVERVVFVAVWLAGKIAACAGEGDIVRRLR